MPLPSLLLPQGLLSSQPDVPERNLLDVSVGKAKTLLKTKDRVCLKGRGGDKLVESRGRGQVHSRLTHPVVVCDWHFV